MPSRVIAAMFAIAVAVGVVIFVKNNWPTHADPCQAKIEPWAYHETRAMTLQQQAFAAPNGSATQVGTLAAGMVELRTAEADVIAAPECFAPDEVIAAKQWLAANPT